MLLLEQDFVHLGTYVTAFHAVSHDNHVIGEVELILNTMSKELLRNIVLAESILIIVLNERIVGHGNFTLAICAIILDEPVNTLDTCGIILVTLDEPMEGLLDEPSLLVNGEELDTGIVLFLAPVIQGQDLLVELDGLVLMGAGGVVTVRTVIGVAHMNVVLGLEGLIERLLQNLSVL
jgi:hypothetical protein